MHWPNVITRLSRYHYFICTLGKAEMIVCVLVKGHYGADMRSCCILECCQCIRVKMGLFPPAQFTWLWSQQSNQVLVDKAFCKSRQDTSNLLSFKMRHAERHAFDYKTSQDVLCISKREEAEKDTETRHCHSGNWKRIKYGGLRSCF